jgi:hypothetical protein
MLFGPPERTKPQITYLDLVRDQIKFFSFGESDQYNPPESGAFSLAERTGRIPWWMVGFDKKDEVREEDRFESGDCDLKIEREVLKDKWGRDFLAERVYLEDSLVRVSTMVSQSSHSPRNKGVFYLHTQTLADSMNGGLSCVKGVVVDEVRDLLRSPRCLAL